MPRVHRKHVDDCGAMGAEKAPVLGRLTYAVTLQPLNKVRLIQWLKVTLLRPFVPCLVLMVVNTVSLRGKGDNIFGTTRHFSGL